MVHTKNNWLECRGVFSRGTNAYRGLDVETIRRGRFTEQDLQKAEARAVESGVVRGRIDVLEPLAMYQGSVESSDSRHKLRNIARNMLGRDADAAALRALATHLRRCALNLHKNDDSDSDEDASNEVYAEDL